MVRRASAKKAVEPAGEAVMVERGARRRACRMELRWDAESAEEGVAVWVDVMS